MTAFIIALITAFILLSVNRQSSRFVLFLIQFAIVFVIMIVDLLVDSTSKPLGPSLSDVTINGPVLTYHGGQWFIYTLIAFGIATIFIKKEKTTHQLKDKDANIPKINNEETEPEAEVVTPSRNVFKFTSQEKPDMQECHPTEEFAEITNTHLETKKPLEIINQNNETGHNLITEQKSINETETTTCHKWFLRKVFSFNLNQTQKIIYGISIFLITLVLGYTIAEDIDSKKRMSETWGVWIIFILIQAWFQNKLWNSGSAININLYIPRLKGLLNYANSRTNSSDKKHPTILISPIVDPVSVKPTHIRKKNQDKTIIIIYGLGALILILTIVAIVMRKDNPFETRNGVSPSDLPSIAPEVSNRPKVEDAKIDTSTTALKLDFELLNGATKLFSFEDEEGFFGTKLSIKYPSSMISAPGDKKRTIRKFAILDEDNSEFRCIINFQPMQIRSSSLEEKKQALSKESVRKTTEQLQSILNKFEILDVAQDIFVATEPAAYSEYYFENPKTDEADRMNSICRAYTFFYSGGVGSVQFYLDSRSLSKADVIKKFESYKRVINRMVNSVELYR